MEALLPLILLVAVFYFLLIRPQQKQRKQLQQVQKALEPGSKVMTGSGLIGTVEAVQDDEVLLEVAPGVTNRFVRRAIVQVIPDETVVPDDASDLTDSEGYSLNESNAEQSPRSDDSDDPDPPKS